MPPIREDETDENAVPHQVGSGALELIAPACDTLPVIIDGVSRTFSSLTEHADPALWRELTQMVMGTITYQGFASLYADQHRLRFGSPIEFPTCRGPSETHDTSEKDA